MRKIIVYAKILMLSMMLQCYQLHQPFIFIGLLYEKAFYFGAFYFESKLLFSEISNWFIKLRNEIPKNFVYAPRNYFFSNKVRYNSSPFLCKHKTTIESCLVN